MDFNRKKRVRGVWKKLGKVHAYIGFYESDGGGGRKMYLVNFDTLGNVKHFVEGESHQMFKDAGWVYIRKGKGHAKADQRRSQQG